MEELEILIDDKIKIKLEIRDKSETDQLEFLFNLLQQKENQLKFLDEKISKYDDRVYRIPIIEGQSDVNENEHTYSLNLIRYIKQLIDTNLSKLPEVKNIETKVIEKAKIKKKSKANKFESFIDIFLDEEDANKILEILKTNLFINKQNEWVGKSRNPTEPVSLIFVLTQKRYTKTINMAPLCIAFKNTYGLNCHSRSFNNGGTIGDIEIFNKIIPDRDKLM